MHLKARTNAKVAFAKTVSARYDVMTTSTAAFDYVFKVLLLGNMGVGKSTLLLRFMDKEPATNSYKPTIGVDLKVFTINYGDKRVKVQLWDTAGQERFNSIVKQYYVGAHAALLVYDVTMPDTFKAIDSWRERVIAHTKDCLFVLVGNKVDLVRTNSTYYPAANPNALYSESSEPERVHTLDAQEYAEERGMGFFETSAKTNLNLESLFQYVISQLVARHLKTEQVDQHDTAEGSPMGAKRKKNKKNSPLPTNGREMHEVYKPITLEIQETPAGMEASEQPASSKTTAQRSICCKLV